jgi:2-polyprenyl-3-methyl-5-hydroxy-6-metoxy-1,4-benzoquinol methylase
VLGDRLFPRSQVLELMDDPSVQGPPLARTLAEIERLNQALNAYGPSVDGVLRLIPPGARVVRVLEVGVGGGDMARRLVQAGAARGLEVHVLGIDLAETTVAYAQDRTAGYATVEHRQQDLFDLPEVRAFDVVHAAQMLHHFPDDAVAPALKKMAAVARHGVVVNDLHRHPVAWAGIRAITGALSRNPMIRNDAPLSVRRGFVAEELLRWAAEVPDVQVGLRWWLPFRWQLVLRRCSVVVGARDVGLA